MPKGSGRTKNLRYGAAEESDGWQKLPKKEWKNVVEDLFDDSDTLSMPDGVGIDDLEEVYDVDIDLISQDANTLAASNVQNLLRLYNNKTFTDEHPDFKRRIDTEIESLRKLYKMAKVNEEVHDHLIHAISRNPGVAGLYMALDRIQGKMLSVDKQIREQISSFNKIITGYQMELNFQQDNNINGGDSNASELDDGSVMARGGKAFVEQMKLQTQEHKPELNPNDLPNNLMADEMTGDVYDEDTGEVMRKVFLEDASEGDR